MNETRIRSVSDICRRSVVTVTEDLCLKDAANKMRTHHVGSLVVVRPVEKGDTVVGMLTDRDIAVVAVARDFDPLTLRAGDVMSHEVTTVSPESSVDAALAVMRSKGVRRLPVVAEDGLLVGIVSLDDLLGVVSDELQLIVAAIQGASGNEIRTRV